MRRLADRSAVLPILAGALYVVLFAARFGDVVRAGLLNGDTASGPVIAQLLGSAGDGREVVLGNFAWATSLWFEQLTGWLPWHRTIWEVGPYLVALAAFALVTVSAARVATRRVAVPVTAVVLLCPAWWTVANLGSWTLHGPTWLALALAGWAVVWTASGTWRATAGRVAGALAIGAAIGASATSDPLTWIAVAAPLALAFAATAVAARRPRAWIAPAAVLAGVVAGALGAAAVMAVQDVHARDYPLMLAGPWRIRHNITYVLVRALAGLGDGDVWSPQFAKARAAHTAGLMLTAAAIASVAWAVARGLPSLVRRDTALERRAHVVFWASAALLSAGSFVVSTSPEGIYSNRYLVGVLLAVAALLPLVAERGPRVRAVVNAGVAAFALVGVVALAKGEMTDNPLRFPEAPLARQLAAFAAARDLRVGYASYWDAMTLTWRAADAGLRVYPVEECAPGHLLCPLSFHRISTWYRPRAGERSFLVLDPEVVVGPLAGVDPRLGPPSSVDHVGRLTVYTFPYDIAARMSRVAPASGAV